MFKLKYLCVVLILFLILNICGCQKNKSFYNDSTYSSSEMHISVNNKEYTVDEVKAGITSTFNSVLYYHGDEYDSEHLTSNKNLVLNKKLKYDLYFKPNFNTNKEAFVFPPQIYLVITNVEHPLSTKEKGLLYVFGIDITEFGLRSDFSYQGHTSKENYNFLDADMVYLGNYTMCIEEIKKPIYKETDEEWSKQVEKSIRLYMDKNNFYSKNGNLESGKYFVYVKKFLKSDKDSVIIFENENGNIYLGDYYFVHDVSNNRPADLNNVVLVENIDKPKLLSYFEKVKTDPAIVVEYVVK